MNNENRLESEATDNGTLPPGWQQTSLGEITIASKEKIDPSQSAGLVYVGLEHIEKGTGKILGFGVSDDVRSTKTKFLEGDLLYGKLRPYLNKVWLADRDGICSTDILVLLQNPNVSNRFLLNRLMARDFVLYSNQQASGIELPRVNFEKISSFEIVLPPLPEQNRIVTKIEELFTQLDAGVAALEKVQAQLRRYQDAVLKAAFNGRLTRGWHEQHKGQVEDASEILERLSRAATTHSTRKYDDANNAHLDGLSDLPEGWVLAQVQDVGGVQLGRQRAPQHHHGLNMRPYLRVANVYEDYIDIRDVKSMNFTPDEFQIYRLEYGDILLNEGQSKELVGRPAIYKNEVPGACFQNTLVRFRAYQDVLPEYALLLFRLYLHDGQFLKIARQSTNIAHLGAERFAKMPFPLAPLLEQKEIVNEIDRHLSIITKINDIIELSFKQAESLRQSILKKAFEGNLVPQDPNDEPASVLLERIKKEKAKQEPAKKRAMKTKTTTQRRLIPNGE